MRVAFIHPFLFRYARGIERFTLNLSNALSRQGVEVHLLTWRWPESIQIDSVDPHVKIHDFPTSRYYAAPLIVPFYVQDLARNAYDFVWIFFAGYGEAEALALVRRRFGIVFHYPYEQVPHRYREFRRYGLIDRAKPIISVSQYVADGVYSQYGRQGTVIWNGVDGDYFHRDLERRSEDRAVLGLSPKNHVLLTVAALEERKGIQNVISALPDILKRNPNIKYFIVGEGSYRSQLEAQISLQHLNDIVRLVGAREDVYQYYNAADIFVLLSHGEAFPIAPLEAMAMELPLVIAEQHPFDEFVRPAFGISVAESNADQIADAISSLMANENLRQSMGSAARDCVLADFTWERAATQYLELMKKS